MNLLDVDNDCVFLLCLSLHYEFISDVYERELGLLEIEFSFVLTNAVFSTIVDFGIYNDGHRIY